MANWERVDTIIDRVEEGLISILLSLMILIAFLQIVLRNVFATGLFWADPFVRNLVLWVGFVGAVIATRAGRHITIDIVPQWVPPVGKAIIGLITQLFSAVICGLLTFAAFKFVRNEALMGSVTFLGIPGWVPQIIMPITFGVMSLQFLFHSLQTFSKIIRKEKN
jgi:C4-dicarboxylate transporter DctQ subunit